MASLEEKIKEYVTILGTKMPRWEDCKKCGAKLACVMGKFGYEQPCPKCKDTPEYEAEQAKKNEESKNMKPGIGQAFKNQQIAGVFEFKGRNIYTNSKGDIIKDEKWRPLGEGDKNWKRP